MKSVLPDIRSNNIQVVVRIKPEQGDISVDECDASVVTVADRLFQFDRVLPSSASQQDVFTLVGQPLIRNALEGFNGCVFAYGQTGSGKTHTLIGNNDGLLPKSLQFLFASADSESLVKGSYLEIYNEHIYDLLQDCACLQLREDPKRGTYVQDLTEVPMSNYDDALQLLRKGHNNRHIAATKMNSESSRSHAIFLIQYSTKRQQEKCDLFLFSKLNFVDLAGSERQKTSQTEGQRLKEASAINKSLTSLGTCISAIVESNKGKSIHIPYRDSKLTNLLKDSLGGNSKTFMIAAINPVHIAETLSTLKFADRVKQIKTRAHANKEYSGEELSKLQTQITQLKQELSEKSRQLEQIQPSDAFQSQLQMYFEEIKQILARINSQAQDLVKVEGDLELFTEKKSVVIQILKTLDFKFKEETPIMQSTSSFESEQKLRTELLQQENVIYKLQKRKKELEQNLVDQQDCHNAILNQCKRNFEDQIKYKEDMITQLKEEIDNMEIGRYNLQKEIDQYKDLIEKHNQQLLENQKQQLQEFSANNRLISEKEDALLKQHAYIQEISQINIQLRQQFENVHSSLEEQRIKHEEEAAALKEYVRSREQQIQSQKEVIQRLQQEVQFIPELNDFRRLYDQVRAQYEVSQKQLKEKTLELEQLGANESILKEEIERLEHQIEVLEVHEDSLNEEYQLYRKTIVELEDQVKRFQEQNKIIRDQLGIKTPLSDDCMDFTSQLNTILKSKSKAQMELQNIKQNMQYFNKQLQMKEQIIKDLQSELQQVQQNLTGYTTQFQLMQNDKTQQEAFNQKIIENLKFEREKLRSNLISLKADVALKERMQKEMEVFFDTLLQKLKDYISQAFRKNRIMSQQQQMLYLKTTELNQKKSTIIECLVDIIILDTVDKQYSGYSQLRLA